VIDLNGGRKLAGTCGKPSSDGFTLLEIMASVVIIGVAMTVLMTDRNESVKRVVVTNNMRTATMLAQQKVNEILLGLEAGVAGEFEDYPGFSWQMTEGVTELLPEDGQTGTSESISLAVTYPTGPGQAEIKLNAHRRGQ
jgi:prepilin-type N-terminal cleavage/methylation domain-containing protein